MDRTRAFHERDERMYPSTVKQKVAPACHVSLPEKLIGTRWIHHSDRGTNLITITGHGFGTLLVMWQFDDGSERHRVQITEEVLNKTLVHVPGDEYATEEKEACSGGTSAVGGPVHTPDQFSAEGQQEGCP